MGDSNGLWYSVGYYQGRGSTYDKRRARRNEPTSPLIKFIKAIVWVLAWGFFLFAI